MEIQITEAPECQTKESELNPEDKEKLTKYVPAREWHESGIYFYAR